MGRVLWATGKALAFGVRMLAGSESRRADLARIRDGLDGLTDEQLAEIVEEYFCDEDCCQ